MNSPSQAEGCEDGFPNVRVPCTTDEIAGIIHNLPKVVGKESLASGAKDAGGQNEVLK